MTIIGRVCYLALSCKITLSSKVTCLCTSGFPKCGCGSASPFHCCNTSWQCSQYHCCNTSWQCSQEAHPFWWITSYSKGRRCVGWHLHCRNQWVQLWSSLCAGTKSLYTIYQYYTMHLSKTGFPCMHMHNKDNIEWLLCQSVCFIPCGQKISSLEC